MFKILLKYVHRSYIREKKMLINDKKLIININIINRYTLSILNIIKTSNLSLVSNYRVTFNNLYLKVE